MEKSLKVLSELENANILGRLHAYLPDIAADNIEDACTKHQLFDAIRGFSGQITLSAMDTTPDPTYTSNGCAIP